MELNSGGQWSHGQDIEPQGKETEEVEALTELRQELAKDIQEERCLEKEYGHHGEVELFSGLASANTDSQGRDIEKVDTLTNIRQEIAADREAERSAEAEE